MQNDETNDDLKEVKEKTSQDIFEALGATDLPEDEKGALLGKMIEAVETRVLTRIIELLPEEEAKALNKFAEDDDFESAQKLMTEKVPNLEQIYKDETEKLRNELIVDFSK